MKRRYIKCFFLLFMVLLATCLLFACEPGGSGKDNYNGDSRTQTNFTLTVTAEGGMVEIISGENKYLSGSTFLENSQITLTAVPSNGYYFEKWMLGEKQLGIDIEYTFHITENINIVALFAKEAPPETTYSMNVIANQGGTYQIFADGTKVNNGSKIKKDSLVKITAIPQAGYHFDYWQSSDYLRLGTNSTYTFSIDDDTVVTAIFSENPVDISGQDTVESEMMNCTGNFAVFVFCPSGGSEQFVREHLTVYDDYFLDKDGNLLSEEFSDYAIKSLGKIDDCGEGIFVAYPSSEYEPSGAYIAKATDGLKILKETSRRYDGTGGAQNAASDGIQTSETGVSEMQFSIDNTEKVIMEMRDTVAIYSYTDNEDALNNPDQIDGWILERIGDGRTDEDGILGGFTTHSIEMKSSHKKLEVDDIIGFGGRITRDIKVEQINEKTVFGKIKSITLLGENEEFEPVYFVELRQVDNDSEIFLELNIYSEEEVKVEDYIDPNDEELKEELKNAFCNSDDFLKFAISSQAAAEGYAEENGYELEGAQNAASFLDKLSVTPTIKLEGNKAIVGLTGSFTYPFGETHSSIGSTKGEISISFGFSETLAFTKTFNWVITKVKLQGISWASRLFGGEDVYIDTKTGFSFDVKVEEKTEFSFDIKVSFSGSTATGKYVLNTETKWIHIEECYHIRNVSDSKLQRSTEDIKAIERKGYTPCLDCIQSTYIINATNGEIHKLGCTHVKQIPVKQKKPSNLSLEDLKAKGYTECHLCTVNQTSYMLNSDSMVVHRIGCRHVAQMTVTTPQTTDDSLTTIIAQGYQPCGTCLTDYQDRLKEESANNEFCKKLADELSYVDWGEKLNKVKESMHSGSKTDESKDLKLFQVTFNIYVNIDIELYLHMSFNIEASLHYQQTVNNVYRVGCRAAIKEGVHPYFNKPSASEPERELTLVGKMEAKIGFILNVDVSDPTGLLKLGIYGEAGVYTEFTGIAHISSSGENYAGAYFELGIYFDFGIFYKVFSIESNISLAEYLGLDLKIPLVKLGYDDIVYAYTQDISEAMIKGSEVKKEFSVGEILNPEVKHITLPKMEEGKKVLNLDDSNYRVKMVIQEEKSWFEIRDNKLVIKDGAPFGEEFQCTVTITVQSAKSGWGNFTSGKDIVYLPTKEITVICGLECNKHALIYLPEEEPTCLNTGLEDAQLCTRCQMLFNGDATMVIEKRVVIPALGHDYVAIPRVEPTCYLTGLTEGQICDRCEYISVPQETIKALGHTAGTEWTEDPDHQCSCETAGIKHQTCIRCELPMNYNYTLPTGHTVDDQQLSCEKPVECLVCGKILAEKLDHNYQIVSEKAPLCEQAGYKSYRCSRCDKTHDIILEPTGHTPRTQADDAIITKQATCEEKGIWSWTCKNCGGMRTEEIDKLDHLYDIGYTIDTPATCTEAGKQSKHCMHDGCTSFTDSTDIPALGHDSQPATCTEDEYCERCKQVITPAHGHNYAVTSENGNISATWVCSYCADTIEHTHTYTETAVEPTCTAQGYTEHDCTDECCNKFYRDAFSTREHDWKEIGRQEATCTVNGYIDYQCQYEDCDGSKRETLTTTHIYDETWTVDAEPKCTEKGSESRHCRWFDTCQSKKDIHSIDATGHSNPPATCLEDGVCPDCQQVIEKAPGYHDYQEVPDTREYENYTAQYKCSRCEDTITQAFEHHLQKVEDVPSTCDTQGYTLSRCTDENCTYEERTNYLPLRQHNMVKGTTIAPKCEEQGYTVYSCSYEDCDYSENRNYTDEKGHLWETEDKVPATCTVPGKTKKIYCLRCGEIEIDSQVISALGHNYKVTTVAPTCLKEGYTLHKCTRNCGEEGEEYKDTIKPAHGVDHIFVKSATCETDGNIEYWHCKDNTCNKYYSNITCTNEISVAQTVISKIGHSYTILVYTKSATCKEEGYYEYKCAHSDSCTHSKVPISKLAHTVVTDSRKDPTCTKTGLTEGSHCSVCKEVLSAQTTISALTHAYNDVVTPPTCTTQGYTTHTCTRNCGETGNVVVDTYVSAHGLTHQYKPASCLEDGYDYYKCNSTSCGKCYKDAQGTTSTTPAECVLTKLGHAYTQVVKRYTSGDTCTDNYTTYKCVHSDECPQKTVYDTHTPNSQCVCTVCEAEDHTEKMSQNGYCRHGDYVYFGTYPQTKVSDSTTITDLNNAISFSTKKPTDGNNNGWTSYKYYINSSNTTDFMWYIDKEYNGNKYRGVYFTSYRPYFTTYSSGADQSNQDNNGYTTSNIYWFQYEPIKWRILEESDGYATILAELILDSQQYDYDGNYSNNYADSTIRAWLNDTFYNTAFTSLQQALIQTVTVDNSARSTNPDNNATEWNSGNNSYACSNTNDKVWLLSEQEVTKSDWGFASYGTKDTARRKTTSDYARCQGAYTYSGGTYDGKGYWWLRSPNYRNSRNARSVDRDGNANSDYGVDRANSGVVPALKICLS